MRLHSGSITRVPGIKVGHAHDLKGKTGVTVILCEGGAVGGADARGFASGTRELGALSPLHLVEVVHAVVLAGGSAFGLSAADGVMQYLEERGIGYDVRGVVVPIVPAAVIFDLGFGDSKPRPDKEMGYRACLAATSRPLPQGSVGAGTGATVGKLYGTGQAMKGGLGTASQLLPGGLIVGALAVVNCFGDVYDCSSGTLLAGARTRAKSVTLAHTGRRLKRMEGPLTIQGENTTLIVVATNVRLTKKEANMVAAMAHDGIARAVVPAHTAYDGDVTFCLSCGSREGDVNKIGSAAVEVVAGAILNGVTRAKGFGIVPACEDLRAGRGLLPSK